MPGFFGLTPQNRQGIFREVFELSFHGQGGFPHSEVYNMPVWMRKAYIQYISDFNKKQQELIDGAQSTNQDDSASKIHRPNINPQTR